MERTSGTCESCLRFVRNHRLLSPSSHPHHAPSFTPDLIKGDLDSLRDDVRTYYSSRGVRIVYDHDQDSTDLMKCIAALVEDERAERHVEVCYDPISARVRVLMA